MSWVCAKVFVETEKPRSSEYPVGVSLVGKFRQPDFAIEEQRNMAISQILNFVHNYVT